VSGEGGEERNEKRLDVIPWLPPSATVPVSGVWVEGVRTDKGERG
jgi:hypothetical protein